MLNMFSFKYYLFSFLLLLQCVVAYSFGLFDNTYSLQLYCLDVSHPLNLFLMHDQTFISLVIYVIIIPMLIPLLLTHLMSTFITPLLKESFRVVFNILLIMVNMSLFATCCIPLLRLCSAIKAYNPFLNNIFNNLVCDNAIIKVIKIMNENDINSALTLCLKTFPNVNMAFAKDMTMKQQITDLLRAQKLDQANLLLDFCKELPPVIKPSWWFTFSTGITNNLHTVASWSYDNLGTVVFSVVTVCLLFKVRQVVTDFDNFKPWDFSWWFNADTKNVALVEVINVVGRAVVNNKKAAAATNVNNTTALAEVSGAVVQTNAKLNMLAQKLANNESITLSILQNMTAHLGLMLNSAITKEAVVAIVNEEVKQLIPQLEILMENIQRLERNNDVIKTQLEQSTMEYQSRFTMVDSQLQETQSKVIKANGQVRELITIVDRVTLNAQGACERIERLDKYKVTQADLQNLINNVKEYVDANNGKPKSRSL